MNSRLREMFERFAGSALAKGVLALVLLVTIGSLLSGPARGPGPTASPGRTSVANTSPTPAPPEPTATPEPWDDLVLEPYVPTAALTPDDVDAIGAAPDTTFTLRSLTATDAVALGSGLRIDPPIAFTVEAGETPDVAIIRPSSPLVAGVRYRFRLESPSGALAGTWAFVARGPLHVVGTLPRDLAVDVPRNTGIEVTFDQDGTTGVPGRLTIEPAVPGRIQQYDRTWAFIPDRPLAAATVYTVTLGSGVGITGSSEVLESDVTFRFETTADVAAGQARLRFGKSILEIRPDQEPVVGIGEWDDEEGAAAPPSSVPVTIHRFPSFDAVEAAGLALAGPDSWAMASPASIVPTAGLDLVAEVDASVIDSNGGEVLRIPTELARGHYLVTVVQPGPPEQLLLQVSNLSAFAQTATGTTVVWVNNLARNAGVAEAAITIVGGGTLGTTDADGLLRRATPAELRIDAEPRPDEESFRPARLLAVAAPDGGRLLVPLGIPSSWRYAEPTWWGYGDQSANWWLLFHSDRTTYRQTDTIHVYGTVRARDDRSVPEGIELRLRPDEGSPDAPIIRVPVNASERGVFVADVQLDDVPRASYNLDLFVGDQRVSSMWINVGEIRKPAYQLAVTTDRHAYVYRQPVHASVLASFYDGTVVPGVDLRFSAFDDNATATTDVLGAAQVDLPAAPADLDPEGLRVDGISVRPASPEEGEIEGTRYVVIAPSRAWLSGEGSIVDGRIVVDGTLSWIDMARLDAAWAEGTLLEDPAGRPIAGGTVRARVIHLVPVRNQIGTTYDFIEKKVVPRYEYDIREEDLGTRTLTAAADGTFRLSMAAPVATNQYRVILTAEDPEGRRVRKTISAAQTEAETYGARRPYLVEPAHCGGSPWLVSGLDETVTVTMHEGTGATAEGRFLFLVSEIGSVEATVQDAATFSRTLQEADLPGFTVRAVWVSDAGYAVSDAVATVDRDDKAITIGLEPDRARYRPGASVTVGVTTTNQAGEPIAADVVVQGVDEKLYTLGFAEDFDPLGELLAMPSSGFLETFRSHAAPREDDGGCGAEGGSREDFRDTVTFQQISTDARGRGSVTFDLSDDLTSWRLSAVAVSGNLDAGSASVLIPVGLPFFVEATLAPEYLVGDQAVLRVRAYGGRLANGDRATFTVSAPSLGLAPTTVEAAAFEAVRVPLPAMVAGDHAIRIDGTATIDGTTFRDSLIRTVHVIDSRLGTIASSYEPLGPDFAPTGGEGLTRYLVTDEGRGRFISLLEELAASTSARFDSKAAAELARQLLIDEFGVPAGTLPETGFDASRYEQGGGIALLPYASGDLLLSARAALVAGSKLDVGRLRSWFDEAASGTATRERRIVALAGRAGLGDDVLTELRAIDLGSLTIRERLWVALGLAAAGDEAGAREIERALLDEHGEQLGPWVRLASGTTMDASLEGSGLLLLLASRLGDPIAHGVARYLQDHRSSVHVFPLELIAYARDMLERVPREAGRFAWTVAGERSEVELEPGRSFTLVLTSGQRETLALEPLQGTLAVVTTWTTTTAALPASGGVTVTRTVTPADDAPGDQLVRVTIRVTFGPQATKGCYRLTDLLPSGLAPVTSAGGWSDEEQERHVIGPYEVAGQRVSWCASPDDLGKPYSYSARVVSPGTYRWEPAVVQSELATGIGAATTATTYTIR